MKYSDTSIDLTFVDARAFVLRTHCEGLTVELEDSTNLPSVHASLAEILEPGLKIYSLLTKQWQGYIVAGAFRHEEVKLVFTDHVLTL